MEYCLRFSVDNIVNNSVNYYLEYFNLDINSLSKRLLNIFIFKINHLQQRFAHSEINLHDDSKFSTVDSPLWKPA